MFTENHDGVKFLTIRRHPLLFLQRDSVLYESTLSSWQAGIPEPSGVAIVEESISRSMSTCCCVIEDYGDCGTATDAMSSCTQAMASHLQYLRHSNRQLHVYKST